MFRRCAYNLVVRSATPAKVAGAVRGQFRELDPNLPLTALRVE
jgi:hypothetical protein